MSRSIHTTRNDLYRESDFEYANREARRARLSEILEGLGEKRRIKRKVRRERGAPSSAPLPPVAPEAVPIDVVERAPWIHYPASPADLVGVMARLPAGVLTGLAGIRLCLGKEAQEELSDKEDLDEAVRDPWTGRAGRENLPGVFGGTILGVYCSRSRRIDLHAYLYDPSLAERSMWELVLRLHMLSTFVHELAHHEDTMRRVARGRWRADDSGKAEDFAETTESRWAVECVVPYLEEAYPDAAAALRGWTLEHCGTQCTLAMLVRSVSKRPGLAGILDFHCSVPSAFVATAWQVHAGCGGVASRLQFADRLVLGGNHDVASRVLDRVLDEDPVNLTALTLLASIHEGRGGLDEAESIARRVVDRDASVVDAWAVLADVHEARQSWAELLAAAEAGLAAADANDPRHSFLRHQCIRAKLELGRFADVEAELAGPPRTRSDTLRCDVIRTLLLLRTGRPAEALAIAESYGDDVGPHPQAVFTAARFEALGALGRGDEAAGLAPDVLATLRRYHHGAWADRLAADHGAHGSGSPGADTA